MNLNRENCLKIASIAGGTAVLYWALNNISQVKHLFGTVLGLLAPFLVGCCIAFALNVPMRALENLIFRPSKKTGKIRMEKIKRPVSLALSIILILAALVLVVAPQMTNVVLTIKDTAPGFIKLVQEWGRGLIQEYPDFARFLQEFNWQGLVQDLYQFLKEGAGSMVNSTVSIIGSVFSGATTLFLGFFFAFYVLIQKETLTRQVKKFLYAHFKSEHIDQCVSVARLANTTFSKFIRGQCLEAVILGVMFWISMTIFRMPYAGTISVLIAFTALIPIFGAFVGMILGVLMILVVNPMQALWFAVMFLVLQQLEGNLIYPRVVGSSVGLPGMWVLVAVTIGGSAFGIMGMLVMVPLASVVYTLVREHTSLQLKKKDIPKSKYLERKG